jgi:hypothetical protein
MGGLLLVLLRDRGAPLLGVDEFEEDLEADRVFLMNIDRIQVGFLKSCEYANRNMWVSYTLKSPVNTFLNHPEPEHKIALCAGYEIVVPLEIWWMVTSEKRGSLKSLYTN